VGILGIILLRVYSRTTFAIFIEIGLYLTEKEQKISWHSFLRHGVYIASLDATRAFDRIHHIKLFEQLLEAGLPGGIVKVIVSA